MPVIDASVVAEYLAGSQLAGAAEEALFGDARTRWVPHLIDAEVGQALRGVVRAGQLDAATGRLALEDLALLPLVRAGHAALLERAWELRDRITFYDGIYVALAELIGSSLVTLDRRLARAAGSLVEVVIPGD